MKKLLLLFFLLYSLASFSQWTQQNSGTTNELTEVYFLNKDTGYAVGGNSLLKTEDGGISWLQSYTGVFQLESIYFANENNGFAVGGDTLGNAIVVKTTNTGQSWTITNFNTRSLLSDIHFVDEMNGFIVGGNGKAFRTKNGGNSWDTLTTGTSLSLESAFFTTAQEGIIVGGSAIKSLILKTTDGGDTWSEITSPSSLIFLQGVFFPSKLIGYIVGWNGEILKTTDGGDSWTQQNGVYANGNLDVFFLDDNTGYIVGGSGADTTGSIQKTTNGGQTWTAQYVPVSNGLIGVYFPKSQIGYAVGARGTILKTINGGATGINDVPNVAIAVKVYPNPFNNQITIDLKNDIKVNTTTIYDLLGQIVFQEDRYMHTIELNSIPKGQYFLVLQTEDENILKRIIKQ